LIYEQRTAVGDRSRRCRVYPQIYGVSGLGKQRKEVDALEAEWLTEIGSRQHDTLTEVDNTLHARAARDRLLPAAAPRGAVV
jgi:hypothetical protein